MHRGIRLGLVAAAAVSLSACGSTVRGGLGVTAAGQSLSGLDGLSADGLSTPTPLDEQNLPDGATGGFASPTGAIAQPGAVGGNSAGVPGSGSATGGSAGVGPNGRGVTASTITIGILTTEGEAGFASSLGVSASGTSFTQREAIDVVVAEVNARGGVLGRKLAVADHPVDIATFASDPDRVVQEVCTDFAQDRPVFAIVTSVAPIGLIQCAAKMGSPVITTGGVAAIFQHVYDANGARFLYGPGTITADRMSHLMVTSLFGRNFFEKWDTTKGGPGGIAPSKIGFIFPSNQAELYARYERELKTVGLAVAEKVTYEGNLSAGLAATQSAILRFKAAGITHVFGASTFFLAGAENQNYRPRYAYIPGLGRLGVQNSPPAQMAGAMTIGWQPVSDVESAQDPGDTPGAKACRAAFARHKVAISSRPDLALAYTVCDSFFFLEAGLNAGNEASAPGLQKGVDSLGDVWKAALTFTTLLKAGHHASGDAVRDMVYDKPCGCLVYANKFNRA